jgi:hypothetical protein
MSANRPHQEGRDNAVRLLRGAARGRDSATCDLFLAETLRLTERERLVARDLLARLVRTVEDEMRSALAERFATHEALGAALGSAHVEIAGPLFDGTAALREPELVGLLLRRAEEHRLFRAAPNRIERLQALIADRDPLIAADAMAVLVARSRRLDRFGEPVLARTELPAELQHRLVWTVAAALRTYMVGGHGIDPAAADRALSDVAAALLAGYDEGDALEARCGRLARRLHGAGQLDGAAIAGFLLEGTMPLFVAGLSAATGIAGHAVWDVLSGPDERGPVYLLAAAGLDRQQTGDALLLLSVQPIEDRLVRQISLFETLDADAAARALSMWTLDPAYRQALLLMSEPAGTL